MVNQVARQNPCPKILCAWCRTVPPRRKEETYTALEKALNTIARDKDRVRWSLLVNSDGMSYSRLRVGGDHHVTVGGRHFTFSVRKHALEGHLCLLAVMHDAPSAAGGQRAPPSPRPAPPSPR